MTTYSPSKNLTREDAAQKLGFSPKEWKRFCGSVVSHIADQLIADGVIKPDGKSKRNVASEVVRFLRKHVDKEGEFRVMPRYDLDILALARELRAKGKLHESCLFYATWFEHRVNFIVTRDRFAINEAEKHQMIREVSLLGKFNWLLPVLGFKRISPENLKVIRRVVEDRNAFVHFKYKPAHEDLQHEEAAQLKSLLSKAEKARCYLEEYEAKYLYSGLKGFFLGAMGANRSAKTSKVKRG